MRWTTEVAGLCLAALAGCGSDTPRQPPVPAPAASAAPEILALPPLQRAVERFPSEHLGETVEAEVWINEAALPYPDVKRYAPAAGAYLVERLFPPGASAPTQSLVMVRVEKGGQVSWRYAAVGPSGQLEPDDPAVCARCHAEAPEGREVFGRPRRPGP